MHRTIRSFVTVVGTAGVLASGRSALAGGCSWSIGSYLNGFVPDFDQRRQPGPLFWDGMNFVPIPDGLPGNGANYCSPTSHVNVMAYLANHGFPALMPGGSAASWGSQTNYERVTDAIQEMGVMMETSATSGTTCCGHSGCVEYLETYTPGKFIVSSAASDAFDAPTIGDLAFCALAGGFVNLMIGWFENTGVNQWQKTGGHVVTMVGIEGWCGGDRKVKIRDPGNGNTSLMEQSVFATNTYTLQQLPGFFDSDGTSGIDVYFQRTYERMLGYNASDGRIGLINGYRVVLPKYGVTLDPPSTPGGPGVTFLNPIQPTNSSVPAVQSFAVPQFAAISDVAISPDGFGVLCIGTDGAGEPDPRVVRLNRATGETTEFTIGGSPVQATINRTGDRSFFVDETGVIRATEPTASGIMIETIVPPAPAAAAQYDDTTDSLIALLPTIREFVHFNPKEYTIEKRTVWPSAVALNGEPYMTVSPLDGSVWLRSRNSPTIYKIAFDRLLGAVIEESVNLPETVGDIGIDVSVAQTREHILLARQTGVIADYTKNTAGQWGPAEESDFAGLPARGKLLVARSRDCGVPELDGPNSLDQLPAASSPPEWDCPGDVDLDGDADFRDVLGVLADWGRTDEVPSDVDGNGGVGFGDVLGVLANWGPCR